MTNDWDVGLYIADPPDSTDPWPRTVHWGHLLPLRWKIDTWAADWFWLVLFEDQIYAARQRQRRLRTIAKRLGRELDRIRAIRACIGDELDALRPTIDSAVRRANVTIQRRIHRRL